MPYIGTRHRGLPDPAGNFSLDGELGPCEGQGN